MGGVSYDRDVGSSSSSYGFSSGGTSSSMAKSAMGRSGAHSDTDPKKTVKSEKESPIVICLDGTGSNIEFARIVYDKAPMLHGQIEQKGYLKDFDICFSVVGDAYCDSAPLQVCDFQYGKALDSELKKLWLESGGGGQHMESYELAAHYFATQCKMPNAKIPFLFMIGDEAPYPSLESRIIHGVLGKSHETIPTKEVLQATFDAFKGNVWYLQNPYYGNRSDDYATKQITDEWKKCLGPKNAERIVKINDEKSVVDVLLGLIAMTTQSRSLDEYLTDMKDRGQTEKRVAAVKRSLDDAQTAIVPYVKAQLPSTRGKRRGSDARRF